MWCAKEDNGVVVFFHSDDPIPSGSTRNNASYWKGMVDAGFNVQYLKIVDNFVIEMSAAEKAQIDANNAQIDANNAQIAEEAEQERLAQLAIQEAIVEAKQAEINAFYNQYLDYCQVITGTRARVGFEEIDAALRILKQTDPLTAFELANTGLMLNAMGQRLLGLQWWDSCP